MTTSPVVLTRERVRHEFAIRTMTVDAVRDLGPRMRRIAFAGSMDGFVSLGPGDHVKVFFPDPVTGELHAPRMTPSGVQRPEGVRTISRDYTPLVRENGALELDFVLHGDTGPASHWASRATAGDTVVIAGPRGSKLLPTGIDGLIIGGDETALPAISRWLEAVDPDLPVTVLIEVSGSDDEGYPLPTAGGSRSITWLHRGTAEPGSTDQLEQAVRELPLPAGPVFWWFGGESGSLKNVRRYLRRESELPKSSVEVSGYWKRGTVNHDHHAPVDPEDPDE